MYKNKKNAKDKINDNHLLKMGDDLYVKTNGMEYF